MLHRTHSNQSLPFFFLLALCPRIMAKLAARQRRKKPQPYRREREASPMTVDEWVVLACSLDEHWLTLFSRDSRLLTRAGRARIRYCFNRAHGKLDIPTLAGLLGTNVSAIKKVLMNKYNRTIDDIKDDPNHISPQFKNWYSTVMVCTPLISSYPSLLNQLLSFSSVKIGTCL